MKKVELGLRVDLLVVRYVDISPYFENRQIEIKGTRRYPGTHLPLAGYCVFIYLVLYRLVEGAIQKSLCFWGTFEVTQMLTFGFIQMSHLKLI